MKTGRVVTIASNSISSISTISHLETYISSISDLNTIISLTRKKIGWCVLIWIQWAQAKCFLMTGLQLRSPCYQSITAIAFLCMDVSLTCTAWLPTATSGFSQDFPVLILNQKKNSTISWGFTLKITDTIFRLNMQVRHVSQKPKRGCKSMQRLKNKWIDIMITLLISMGTKMKLIIKRDGIHTIVIYSSKWCGIPCSTFGVSMYHHCIYSF